VKPGRPRKKGGRRPSLEAARRPRREDSQNCTCPFPANTTPTKVALALAASGSFMHAELLRRRSSGSHPRKQAARRIFDNDKRNVIELVRIYVIVRITHVQSLKGNLAATPADPLHV
jgi:hypothetical protein